MDQWSILVLGTLRLGLNADYDRILELANQHKTSVKCWGLAVSMPTNGIACKP